MLPGGLPHQSGSPLRPCRSSHGPAAVQALVAERELTAEEGTCSTGASAAAAVAAAAAAAAVGIGFDTCSAAAVVAAEGAEAEALGTRVCSGLGSGPDFGSSVADLGWELLIGKEMSCFRHPEVLWVVSALRYRLWK